MSALAEGLEALRRMERDVQLATGGQDALLPDRDTVAQFSMALIAEVVEVADELQWKRWKRNTPSNAQAALAEMSDVLAFLGLLLNWLDYYGISMTTLAQSFADKCQVNVARLRGEVPGYGLRPLPADANHVEVIQSETSDLEWSLYRQDMAWAERQEAAMLASSILEKEEEW